VQFCAQFPLQFVLSPQLQSLANAADAAGEQIWRFVDEGFFDLHTAIPFALAHFMSSAAAAKKDPGKWRRTSDGGAPRQDLLDGEGIRAISINKGIGLKPQNDCDPMQSHGHNEAEAAERALKWRAQEAKPRVCDVMYGSSILRHAGRVLHEPLLSFVDDFARFFDQPAISQYPGWSITCGRPHARPECQATWASLQRNAWVSGSLSRITSGSALRTSL